ncbi:MAG: hypothetical protein HC808_03660 [Candidatus Competibacteraceae bacterium]|nr:hypothetical protein [Candidatus Competibacteraceae bacterium]
MDATLSGLVATGLPASNVCGVGSTLSGTGLLSLTGGNLTAGESCTFSVELQVSAVAAGGAYPNTTSTITADVGGMGVVGQAATETLFITDISLTKTFLDNPVGAGGTSELEFTITNNSSTSTATNITFQDNFPVELQTGTAIPANGFCGAGSTATFTPLFDPNPPCFPCGATPARLTVSNATLTPGASCTFSIMLDVVDGVGNRLLDNTTSDITATVNGVSQVGKPASDALQVLPAPTLSKSFADDPVLPNAPVTLEFTVSAPGVGEAMDSGCDLGSLRYHF